MVFKKSSNTDFSCEIGVVSTKPFRFSAQLVSCVFVSSFVGDLFWSAETE